MVPEEKMIDSGFYHIWVRRPAWSWYPDAQTNFLADTIGGSKLAFDWPSGFGKDVKSK